MTSSLGSGSRKPVIGMAGGIGSGKSTIARMFGGLAGGELTVIDSDQLAHEVIQSDAVKRELAAWWGNAETAAGGVFKPDGSVDRRAVAKRIFNAPDERKRLEAVIHPAVAKARAIRIEALEQDPQVKAIVLDTPLLFETGLNTQCDATVYVDVPRDVRLARLQAARGWSENDLMSREKNQLGLEKKRELADYVVNNGGDQAASLSQVRRVFSQIIEKFHA